VTRPFRAGISRNRGCYFVKMTTGRNSGKTVKIVDRLVSSQKTLVSGFCESGHISSSCHVSGDNGSCYGGRRTQIPSRVFSVLVVLVFYWRWRVVRSCGKV